jgi:hypothetical protein
MSNLALPAIGDQTGMALGVQIMKWAFVAKRWQKTVLSEQDHKLLT